MTKKIYYNLQESTYSISINGIEYFFSSKFNLDRFKCKIDVTRKDLTKRFIMKKYPITMKIREIYNLESLSDLNLYLEVENRGYCVKIEGVFIPCQKTISIILQKEIKNYSEKQTKESEQNNETSKTNMT